MLGLFYRIWADMIIRMRKQPANKGDWQIKSMVAMTTAMTFNLALIMLFLQKFVFGINFYKLNIAFLPVYYNNLFSFLILFVLPCIVINYCLIFRNKRYENILERYGHNDSKLSMIYFSISMLLPVLLLVIGLFYSLINS